MLQVCINSIMPLNLEAFDALKICEMYVVCLQIDQSGGTNWRDETNKYISVTCQIFGMLEMKVQKKWKCEMLEMKDVDKWKFEMLEMKDEMKYEGNKGRG